MDIKEMNFDELQTRKSELAEELKTADLERLDGINAELDAIEERKNELKAEAEERAKVVEEIINAPEPTPIIEERNNTMTSKEIRNSQEYIDAYVEYCKRGYDLERMGAEARTLLTQNAENNGTIAVPVYVEERINTAWENDEIMKRVRRTFLPGNVKVGVEVASSGAVVHPEGGEAITEETLNITYVNLVGEYLKKMVKISHTAMALTGTSFLDYLYDEIEYHLVKKAVDETLTAISSSNLAETVTLAQGTEITTATIIEAEGRLGGEARDVVAIMSRATASSIKAKALENNFYYDPFDGLEVLYADTDKVFIVDLSGVQANFPEGANPRFIFDEFTEAPANIVRIIGRLLFAVDLVAKGKAVIIDEGEE